MSEIVNATAEADRKWTRVSWKRVAAALFLLFALCLAVECAVWFFEPWYFARQMSTADPYLNVTPSPLPNESISLLAMTRLQCFQFSFNVPWKHVESRKDAKSATIIRFTDGPEIIVFDPATMSSVTDSTRTEAIKLRSIFGAPASSTGYDWMGAELTATPGQIRWWNRSGNVRLAVLLGLKQIDILDSTAIYRLGNAELHGFQFGDPTVEPYRIRLELFDVNNRRYELVIASPKKGPIVDQADINGIIATFRPIPHS